jgi:hypothetical protein
MKLTEVQDWLTEVQDFEAEVFVCTVMAVIFMMIMMLA